MKKNHITLTAPDRQQIKDSLSKGNLQARVYRRLTGLLLLDEHKTIGEVATILKVRRDTVAGWRTRYNQGGLRFLVSDRPRSGRPAEINGSARAKITALACSEPPQGYSQWSLRLLADKVVELNICGQISYRSIGKILKKTDCSHT